MSDLLKRMQASIESHIQTGMMNAHRKVAIIGLSGGLDSAYVAATTVRAFKKRDDHEVKVYYLPYKTSSAESESCAKDVAKNLGLDLVVIDISNSVDVITHDVSPTSITKERLGNICARVRMTILYEKAATWDGVVMGTGNLSEGLMGYTTKWGDQACDINVLGSVTKTQVRALAVMMDEIPLRVIQRAPTADLWEGQTDEGELGMTYEELDKYLKLRELDLRGKDVASLGFDYEKLAEIDAVVNRASHKRELAEPPRMCGC